MKIKPYMEDFIKENYGVMTYRAMAEHLGENVTTRDIQYWLEKNGLWKREKKRKYSFSDEEVEFMIANYQNMEYGEIANKLGIDERQVRGKLNNLGYTKLREFNKHYFHNIDSNLKAYFLGFIYADGWVVFDSERRNYELGMELQSGDKYILDELNKEIGGVHKIMHYNPEQRIIDGNIANVGHHDCLRIYSKNIVEDLISHGIVPNKTYNYKIPEFPMEYFFDFLRGYIDGDGCYCINKKTIDTTMNVNISIVCASPLVLEWIQSILKKYNINTHVYMERNFKYRLCCYNQKSVYNLINLLYHDNDSLCLSRKYNKIKHLLNGRPC